MLESWETMPDFFITSADTGAGKTELLSFIEKVNLAEKH
jgi:GTP-binding protein